MKEKMGIVRSKRVRKDLKKKPADPDGGMGFGSSIDSSDDDEAAAAASRKPAARRLVAGQFRHTKRRRNQQAVNGMSLRNSNDIGGDWTQTDAETEEDMAFCCKVCHCPDSVKRRFVGDEYIQPSEECLYHRQCCHFGGEQGGEATLDWLPEFHVAVAYLTEHWKTILQEHQPIIETVDPVEVYQKYMTNKGQETRMINEDEIEYFVDRVRSNPTYAETERRFRKVLANIRKQNSGNGDSNSNNNHIVENKIVPKRLAVVIDLFGGIGAAIVCLKRLQIAIQTVIHVEHDKVANAVYKYWHNHDADGINHIFISKFEDFEQNIDHWLHAHGPFDIICGGPPCVDYTPINANRQGVDGFQGSFFPRMGRLVQHIYKYSRQHGQYCFYMAENAALSNQEERELEDGDLERILAAFSPPPTDNADVASVGDDIDDDKDDDRMLQSLLAQPWHYILDSGDVTPLRRVRTYITNIPSIDDLEFADIPPRVCFDDDYDIGGGIFEPKMLVRAPGLMASKSRLDDHPRMSIFREFESDAGKLSFDRRTPTVTERERLMGFDEGYVHVPVDELFTTLLTKGHEMDKKRIPGAKASNHWKDHLPEQFHEFAGDFHGFNGKWRPFRFDFNPLISLELAPPLATERPYYYNSEEYSKRLIGNSFSIPIVEFILAPIRPFFAQREYTNFSYKFAWQRPGVDLTPPFRSDLVEELVMNEKIRYEEEKDERVQRERGQRVARLPIAAQVAADQESDFQDFDV